MAVLATVASGNFTSSATWCVVDSTSYNNSETATTALLTSYQTSSTFTPGAITISHIGIKLSVRTGTTGTISVALDQGGSDVAGTTVTINTADFPVAATADVNGGWHFFKLSSPVTLLAATAYGVKAKTSSSSQISLFSTATTNWSRALITTTMQAPAAGDDLIINGEYTGAGTSNSFTVTMDETATTDYGSASTSLVTPAISICNKGTLSFGTSVSTNYNLKVSGNIVIYSNGIFNIGTIANPIPRTSSATLLIDSNASVAFGIILRNRATMTAQGLSRTINKNIVSCLLTSDVAINGTTFNVNVDTGWLDNDDIAIASTTRTYNQFETGQLNGNAGSSSFSVKSFTGSGGGVLNAHLGTTPIQADIILLNRNVKILGASSTNTTYIVSNSTSTLDFDWVELRYFGSATSLKRGVDIFTTTGSISFTYCSFRDFNTTSAIGLNINASTTTNNIEIAYCNFYNNYSAFNIGQTTISNTSFIFKNVICIGGSNSSILSPMYCTEFHDITISGINSNGLTLADVTASNYTNLKCDIYNIKTYSNSAVGLYIYFQSTSETFKLYNFFCFRNNAGGILISTSGRIAIPYIKLDNINSFGNANYNINISSTSGGAAGFIISNSIFSGDTSFSTPVGLFIGNGTVLYNAIFTNCNFGTSSGIYTTHTTADIDGLNISTGSDSNYCRLLLINTNLSSSTEITLPLIHQPSGIIIASQNHDKNSNLHKTWKTYGILTIENSITKSGSTSLKMSPTFSTKKLESSGYYGGFKVPISNTKTCTPSIWVYEDATYNGSRARLIVKQNDALGITSDTVLSTATSASDLAWENLTGTTIAVTDDGTLEFVIDCDGTTGNIYIDEFNATIS